MESYRKLIEELRYNVRQKGDLPVPVFPFGYDWRQPLELLDEMLVAFIDEVIARTLLLHHYHDAQHGYACVSPCATKNPTSSAPRRRKMVSAIASCGKMTKIQINDRGVVLPVTVPWAQETCADLPRATP